MNYIDLFGSFWTPANVFKTCRDCSVNQSQNTQFEFWISCILIGLDKRKYNTRSVRVVYVFARQNQSDSSRKFEIQNELKWSTITKTANDTDKNWVILRIISPPFHPPRFQKYTAAAQFLVKLKSTQQHSEMVDKTCIIHVHVSTTTSTSQIPCFSYKKFLRASNIFQTISEWFATIINDFFDLAPRR